MNSNPTSNDKTFAMSATLTEKKTLLTVERTFTNKPQIRRKQYLVSKTRAKKFMFWLWQKGLKKCSYSTLEFEFIQFFGTNESRTLTRYIGQQKQIIRSNNSTMQRINYNSGKVANFSYLNKRTIHKKRGLLDILGYITPQEDGTFKLNHERFSYYLKQLLLNANPQPESESGVSIPEMCVCSNAKGIHQNVEQVTNVEMRERVIDTAHTNQSSESIQSMPKKHDTCISEHIKCIDCGRQDESNPQRILCPCGYGLRGLSDTCAIEKESG
jgi:hypothetical protein